MPPYRVLDFRVVPRIKECLGSWTPPGTITPHKRYVELYKMQDRLSPIPMDELIAEMNAAGVVKAVVCAADLETTWGRKTPNEVIANLQRQYPDVFTGFAGVDPHKGMAAVRELEHAVTKLGLKGLNVGPWLHRLLSNDKRYYPLYAKCVELDIPVVVHCASHFDPTMSMDTGNPVYLDEVACHFPELKIVASHAGWPWVKQAIALAWRHEHVYLEISGIIPRYLDPDLVSRFDNTLQDKVLFATSYPVYTFRRGVEEFLKLPIREETKEKILYRNAARLLGLKD